jgi:hypothetical protein
MNDFVDKERNYEFTGLDVSKFVWRIITLKNKGQLMYKQHV